MEFNDEGPEQIRSYSCAFCKRGFSNAQALGGHMTTHRRDRAKLRQCFEENLLSLEISMKNTIDHEPQPLEEKKLFTLEESGDQKKNTSNLRKPCNFIDKDDYSTDQRGKAIGTVELPKLPLFVGTPTSEGNVVVECIEEKKIDLDLELRLGPEPQDASNLSTREFF